MGIELTDKFGEREVIQKKRERGDNAVVSPRESVPEKEKKRGKNNAKKSERLEKERELTWRIFPQRSKIRVGSCKKTGRRLGSHR